MRVAVAGAAGRMGRVLARLVDESPDLKLCALWEAPESAEIGQALHGVTIGGDARTALAGSDVYIDFTRPAASLEHARLAGELGVAGVVGTTGFSEAEFAALRDAAAATPLVWQSNFSLGVNLLEQLAALAARALAGYDIEIIELHHNRKHDAPSGTASTLWQAVREARGLPEAAARYGRPRGMIGERSGDEVGIHALRLGDVVGDHTVLLAGPGERVELTHRAQSRDVFAHGALRAARWAVGRPSGLYSMRDVLGWTR